MKPIKNIAMIATATVAMMAMSVNHSFAASTPEPAHCFASEVMNAPRVMQYYHINNDNQTRRFEYTVDAKGRVTDKVMFGWNQQTSTWKPMCQYHADYGTDSHELTFSSWDDQSQSFSDHITTMHFNASDYPAILIMPEGAF